MRKSIKTIAYVLSGIGAANWGTLKFLNFDVLSIIPAGIITTGVIAAIAASGILVLYNTISKKE